MHITQLLWQIVVNVYPFFNQSQWWVIFNKTLIHSLMTRLLLQVNIFFKDFLVFPKRLELLENFENMPHLYCKNSGDVTMFNHTLMCDPLRHYTYIFTTLSNVFVHLHAPTHIQTS